jgi:hypothetical protein
MNVDEFGPATGAITGTDSAADDGGGIEPRLRSSQLGNQEWR